jgi:NAD dependent epimerase/dehydratase family enzyme
MAVVNLSGENVGGCGPLPRRWDPALKAALRASRLDTTAALVQAVAATPSAQRPRVLVNASAIG